MDELKLKVFRILDKYHRIGEDEVLRQLREECGLTEAQVNVWIRYLRTSTAGPL
jgi:hypothetical protein